MLREAFRLLKPGGLFISSGFKDFMRGLIKLSPNPSIGAGAVFVAQKPE